MIYYSTYVNNINLERVVLFILILTTNYHHHILNFTIALLHPICQDY